MYISDNAIKNEEEDKLNRAEFSKKLGEQILSYGNEESKVIALYGDWGKGKTSILNIAMSQIEKITQSWKKSKRPIIFKFNPWNFSEQEGLLFAFLKQLFSEVNNKLPALKKDFQKDINSLAKALGAFENLPIAGLPFTFTSKAVNLIVPEETLESLRMKIDEFFKELEFKVIIVIDDIDRLTENEIRLMFQLIKINANFPNTLYLVAFDRKIVEGALDSTQGSKDKGRAYIEKIVQVAFDIPKVESARLEEFLSQRLSEILAPIPDKNWNNERWVDLYHSGFKNLFTNIRDVKRFINSLSFTINIVQSEINPVDFIGLEALRVFLPDIYYGISRNKDLFTSITWFRQNETEGKLRTNAVNQIMQEAGSLDKIEMARSICIKLFPPIQTYFGGSQYSGDYIRVWRSERRVCSAEVFDTYFMLGLPKGEISQEEISAIIETVSDKTIFSSLLNELITQGRISRFLNLAQDKTKNLKPEHIKGFTESLVDLGEIISKDTEELSIMGSDFQIARLIYLGLMNLDLDARFTQFGEVLDSSEALYQLVFVVSLDSRSKEGSRRDAPLFDDESLVKLQEKCALKIEQWAKTGRLINSNHLGYILFRWLEWGAKSSVDEFVANSILTSEGLIKVLRGFVSSVQVFGARPKVEWQINIKNVAEFIEPELIIKKLDDIPNSKTEAFGDEEKRVIEVFRKSYSHWLATNKKDDFPYRSVED